MVYSTTNRPPSNRSQLVEGPEIERRRGPLGFGFKNSKGEAAGEWTKEETELSTHAREMETQARCEANAARESAKISIYETDSTVLEAYNKKIYGKSASLSRRMAKIKKHQVKHGIIQKAVVISQAQIRDMDALSRQTFDSARRPSREYATSGE